VISAEATSIETNARDVLDCMIFCVSSFSAVGLALMRRSKSFGSFSLDTGLSLARTCRTQRGMPTPANNRVSNMFTYSSLRIKPNACSICFCQTGSLVFVTWEAHCRLMKRCSGAKHNVATTPEFMPNHRRTHDTLSSLLSDMKEFRVHGATSPAFSAIGRT
jgi:hypothetical protein